MNRKRFSLQELLFCFITFILVLIFLLGFCSSVFADKGGRDTAEIISEAKKSVARIVVMEKDLSGWKWSGTAFGVATRNQGPGSPDIFITNRHCISDMETGEIYDNIYLVLDDEAIFTDINYVTGKVKTTVNLDHMVECKVLYPTENDPIYPDFAIVQTVRKVNERTTLPLLSAKDVPDSTPVYAIGYPGNADDLFGREITGIVSERILTPSSIEAALVTDGSVSRKLRDYSENDTYYILNTAHINHGNSGGPLITENGYVIGITKGGANEADNGVAEYNLSVYIDYAMNKLDELGIEYDTYKPLNRTLIIAISAGAVAIVVILIVLLKSAKKKPQPVPKEYRLQCISGIYAGRRFPIKGVVKLGRLKDHNDLIFPDGIGVSGMHCQLKEENDTVYLIDLNSRNGTWVNGEKLQPGEPRELKEGDSFCIGKNREGKITEGFRIDVNKVT